MTSSHEPFAGFDAAGSGGAPAATAAAGGGPRGPGRAPEPPAGLRTWARDLWLGARFAAGGGREGWTRTALTAVGVGLGVALLLLAAAVPAMMHTRDGKRVARDTASTGVLTRPTDTSLLLADVSTTFRDKDISGVLLQPEGARAGRPPGVRALPGPGRMVVSPALGRLLASSPLLRARIPYTIVGTIGHAGLMGPAELYYYAGSTALTARDADYQHGDADRVSGFGHRSNSDVLGPTFMLLLIVMLVVLLLPVAIFVGTAVRLGGERRDRRLAALRLVGADIRSTRRIAAGEALLGALLGLVCGAGFFLIGRQLASHVTIRDISAYPADLTPNTALTVLVALAVPVAAIAVTLLSLRGTVIEPLGVVRRHLGRRRRLWWRLVVPALGLGLLAPLFGTVRGNAAMNEYQVTAGTVMLLVGVTTVLPWLVEAVVGRLRGGPVAWQLATRRLQLSSSASARMVSGVTVAVAGAIALQMLFTGVNGDFVRSTGADPARAQATVDTEGVGIGRLRQQAQAIAATKGVRQVYGYVDSRVTQAGAAGLADASNDAYIPLVVGDCDSLAQLAQVTGCAPGSVFAVPPTDGNGDDAAMRKYARPGMRVDLNAPYGDAYSGKPRLWTIPAATRTAPARIDPTGSYSWGVLATPEAVGAAELASPSAQVMVGLDPRQPDAVEYLRNTAAGFGVDSYVMNISGTVTSSQYVQLRRALVAGAALTMSLIGASLLVTMLEQLRDRRKLLAVLVAFGTRRSALAWSVLWQTAIPVLLGLVLACAGGIGLGAALLAMVGSAFHVDWGAMATMSAVGGAVVFAVTLLSLPPLWRMMRPDGLRTE
ncbi:ABC transporter permease [Streptomyces sp. V4-01]|uniref:ABC transporter permease n=1 Tax=Actinacidiphila polyblastidii TaxID=3110430 RepID=A0ABU7PCI9_9ACTN|nr:ABC transporter permease [Streptomyces sp. V4-01]